MPYGACRKAKAVKGSSGNKQRQDQQKQPNQLQARQGMQAQAALYPLQAACGAVLQPGVVGVGMGGVRPQRGPQAMNTRAHVAQVLEGVSGVLRPGTATLLLGPPGAGKSTLLKALSGQLRPSRLVKMQNFEVWDWQPDHAASAAA